jgi:large subunit ribosomal protein L13
MKTFRLRKEDVQRRWVLIDASDQILGRLAARVAMMLMGKDKPTYTPGVDSGEFVVVTNASAVRVTGRKESDKLYRRYTGYVGGLVEETLSEIRSKKPEKLVVLAVKRMLPKTRLGQQMLKRLKVYPGAEHPHQAQKPEPVELVTKR